MIETHPVQVGRRGEKGRCPVAVTMKAYEVYCHVFAPQPAIVTGECRGGFSTGELIALLYAATFPKAEWSKRVYEALEGMEGI